MILIGILKLIFINTITIRINRQMIINFETRFLMAEGLYLCHSKPHKQRPSAIRNLETKVSQTSIILKFKNLTLNHIYEK